MTIDTMNYRIIDSRTGRKVPHDWITGLENAQHALQYWKGDGGRIAADGMVALCGPRYFEPDHPQSYTLTIQEAPIRPCGW